MTLSTHVLDLAGGHPAAGIEVRAELWDAGWQAVGQASTDADGRIAALVAPEHWSAGHWRVTFELSGYAGHSFLRAATVEFEVASPERIHLPLLLSPYGFSTYRGS